ncbi:MAG: glycosyltransferase family 2 protein, partial [Paramuribaculum sp.]|nr:glycosyltransferase family 2 protein [Paramuribaculum sp.]
IDSYKNTSFARQRSFISYVAGKMIHKDAIGTHRFNTNFTNGEDSLFMTSITENVRRIRFAPLGIYFVRERDGSASRKHIPLRRIIKDSAGLIFEYIKTYIGSPKKYSFGLFFMRIPGVLKNSYSLLKYK